jgi:ribosomal protein S18 acetylase RimI-like enzyme
MGGSQIEDRGDHLLVRSPHNPLHWWGNFIVLPSPPDVVDVPRWIERFHDELPDAEHLAFAVDDPGGTTSDLAGFAVSGLTVHADTVMTAQRVHPPPRSNAEADYRELVGDDDWAQLVQLGVACDDRFRDEAYLRFLTDRAATSRRLVEAGHAVWSGAFVDGRLLSSMGLVDAGDGLARFQSVQTHPEARGRGLAGTLVHHVSRLGLDEREARTLVMVADPEYLAIRIYRSVGFAATETQLQAERPPATAGHEE